MEELVTLTRKVQGLKKSISRISGLPSSIMEVRAVSYIFILTSR